MGTTDSPSDENGSVNRDSSDIDLDLVLLTGFDERFAQNVPSRSSYEAGEVVNGARFASMFDHEERFGLLGVDLARIHDVLPASLGRNGDS